MKMVHATSLDSVRIDILGEGRGLTIPCSLILEWNEAHRQGGDETDQQQAIAVMKRYGCYIVPNGPEWELYDSYGNEFTDDDGVIFPLFPSPEAALIAAGEYLDAQGKERGE